MAEVLELLHQVPVFADLPQDQIDWFLDQSRVVPLKAGDAYVRQGDPADAMFVLLEGQFQWRGEFSGETFVRDMSAGEVTGILPFSRMKTYLVTGRALLYFRQLKYSFPKDRPRVPSA